MKLTFVNPRTELRPYVESVWIFESPNGLPATDLSVAAPNGCPKFIFPYENSIESVAEGKLELSPAQRLYFVGNRDSSTLIRTRPCQTGFIGIEFFPHGAFPIFGIPMSETSNLVWESDVVFGNWGRDLHEKLNEIQAVEQKVACIQKQLMLLLLKNVRDNRLVEYCVKTLKSTCGRISLQELERKTGYSRRYLDLLFRQRVGLPPKVLAGIFRFQKFYRKWAEGQSFDVFKENLYDHYYDQAHFTKEFKRMTGYSPREFSIEVSNEFGRRLLLH